jgi:uncharacterized protein YjaG (DUF416 family)
MKKYDEVYVSNLARKLKFQQASLFLIFLAERFYPFYEIYASEYQEVEGVALREVIDDLWLGIHQESYTVNFDLAMSKVEDISSSLTARQGKYTDSAIAACAIVMYLINYINTRELDNVIYAVRTAYEAVHAYVGWFVGSETGQFFEDTNEMFEMRDSHELVQSEINTLLHSLEAYSHLEC